MPTFVRSSSAPLRCRVSAWTSPTAWRGVSSASTERRLLLQFIEQHEARVARLEELKIKKALEGLDEIDWDAEREEVYQRLLKATAEIVQLPATDDQ
jgi:hypothetical protein